MEILSELSINYVELSSRVFNDPKNNCETLSVTLNHRIDSSSAHKSRLHAINNRPTDFVLCLLDRSHSRLNKRFPTRAPYIMIFYFRGKTRKHFPATVDLNMPSCQRNKSPLYTRLFAIFQPASSGISRRFIDFCCLLALLIPLT